MFVIKNIIFYIERFVCLNGQEFMKKRPQFQSISTEGHLVSTKPGSPHSL